MATSPTTNSALLSGAAKDDAVGLSGNTFTIDDLLANDPKAAAKVDLNGQFFFGDSAADQNTALNPNAQRDYLAAHHIEKISEDNGGTYQINAGATDFNYFAQMGNKGTWSKAHVDVAHEGADLFTENFDDYAANANPTYLSWEAVDLTTHGWTTKGADTEVAAKDYLGAVHNTSGNWWLDTQATDGPINISHRIH